MKKKAVSLMLCIAMLFSLTACGQEAETTPPTTTAPPVTTEPAPDPALDYADAASRISESASVLVNYTVETEMKLGGDVYAETQTTSLSLTGRNTADFAGKSTTSYTWGADYYADASDIFIDGTLYSQVDNRSGSTEITGEEYLDRFLPAVLLTPSLYETVAYLDETTVSFTDAIGPEPWLNADGAVLTEASGTAVIEGGELKDCTYHAVYTVGGVSFEVSVSSRAITGPIQVDAPVSPETYLPTETPDLPLIYERAIGLILQAGDVTSTSAEEILIEAGAVLMTQQCTMNSYGTGADLMAQFDTDIALTDLSTLSSLYSISQQEIFQNGVYTYSADGSAAQADTSVTADTIRYACQSFTADMFSPLTDFAELTVRDMGAAWLLEYTLTEDAAQTYTTTLCGAIFEDANLLNDNATAYRTETASGYIGIDKLTSLPLSLGSEYLGYHTIDGVEYALAYNHSQNVSVGTGAGYEAVTGEALPPEEPEQKATPLLYHVTGDNGEELWLFGTIHVGDERTAYLPQALLDAFAASDALAVEFDTDAFTEQIESDPEMASLIAECYFYTDGTTTTDHLENDALYEDAVRVLKSLGGYYSTMEMVRPIILSQIIENTYLDLGRSLSGSYGADSQLLKLAREQDKQILNVESGEAQLKMLTGYSDALQEYLLEGTMEMDPEAYQAEIQTLYELWCLGDEQALIEALFTEEAAELTEEEAAFYEEYYGAMSSDRNVGMLEVAKGYLSSGDTVFYAVGLAHLLAEDGLVNTLRAAGYTVELVSYE